MIQLTAVTLPVLASLILAIMAAAWTVLLHRRSAELPLLALFFSSGSAFLLALLMEFAALAGWREYAVLAEYPLVAIAFCALASAAHASPLPGASREQRLVRVIAFIVSMMTTVYAATLVASRSPYALRRQSELDLQILTLLVLAAFLLALIALIRGAQRYGAAAGLGAWQALRRPPAGPARRWRNMALALGIPGALCLVTVFRTMQLLTSSGLQLFLGIGAVIFVGTLIAIPTTDRDGGWSPAGRTRLLIATVILVVWGCASALVGRTIEEAIYVERLSDAVAVRALLHRGEQAGSEVVPGDLPAHVLYVLRRRPDRALIVSRAKDLSRLAILDDMAQREHGGTQSVLSALLQTNPALSRDQALVLRRSIRNRALHQVRVYGGDGQQRYAVVGFEQSGESYEVGFSYQVERQELHERLVPYALWTLAIGLLLGAEALIAAYRGRRR